MATLFANQLQQTLQQQQLPPVVLVFGEEPLLREDCRQQLRQHLQQQFGEQLERCSYRQEHDFDWQQLAASGQSMSLFGSFTLVELELPDNKPGREGSEALTQYAKQPPEEQLLVVFGDRLKKEQQNSRWFKALQENAWLVRTPTPDRSHLPRFIHQRAQQHQLSLDEQAVALLSQWFEGNLSALDQELQKWALLYPQGQLSAHDIKQTMQDVSQFSTFSLQDSLLQGDLAELAHRLHRLFEEDVDQHALFWVIQREVQVLSQLQLALANGINPQTLYRQNMIWSSQQRQYQQRAEQLPNAALSQAQRLLERLEYALKDDSGEDTKVLFLHLVGLLCPHARQQQLTQQLTTITS